MTLGERIASLRKEKGLSQEALGELVGVTRQAVSKWEADKTLPDVNYCVALSRVFEVPLTRLLDLEDEQNDAPADELDECSPSIPPIWWSRWPGSMLRRSAAFAVGTAGH